MNVQLKPLADQIARRFIARSDVKAVQWNDGGYRPERTPIGYDDLYAHLEGRRTLGHYLINPDGNRCKFFSFDCDLEKGSGTWVQLPDSMTLAQLHDDASLVAHTRRYQTDDLRGDWRNRAHPGRAWYKFQMRAIADLLAGRIRKELDIPVACAYSGNKGVHVYGFTGLLPAAHVREAAQLILASFGGRFVPHGGDVFYKDTSEDWYGSFGNFSIEVFPKQSTVDQGKFGNLMRLPLGVNLKNPGDPTFFLDQRRPPAELAPHPDPVALLTTGDPWS